MSSHSYTIANAAFRAAICLNQPCSGFLFRICQSQPNSNPALNQRAYSVGDGGTGSTSHSRAGIGRSPPADRRLPDVLRSGAGRRAQPALLLEVPAPKQRGTPARRVAGWSDGGFRNAVLVLQLPQSGGIGAAERPVAGPS